ncbi:MAG: glycosyltransferase family 4 protein [Sphingomicrobium sp.]
MTSNVRNQRHVAYLTSQYPATSHTFILREVEAVRAAGVSVQTFTVRPPSDEELTDPAIAAEAVSTFVILAQSWPSIIVAHIRLVAGRPADYARGLVQALRHRPPGIRGFALALAHFAEAGVLANELQRRRVDHLHNHFANSAATVGYLAAGMIDLPWSFMIHGISETDYPAGVTLPDKIRAARFVACASWFGRAQAMRVVEPEHWPKIHVVRCGLRLDRLPSPEPDRSGRRILCVGRLSPEKGQAGLIEAFAAVRDKIGDARLELIGTGPAEDVLRRQVALLGLEQAVTFAGRRSEADTLAVIAAADVLVVSSFMEGLPIVLMEAMALGTAVIAPRLAGIPELVDDGRTGLLFTPSNWQELESQILGLLTDNELRGRLSAEAYQTIISEFDVKRSAKTLAALFADNIISPEVASITGPGLSGPSRAVRRE